MKFGQGILQNGLEINRRNYGMDATKKIRVAWICSISNPMIREYLDLGFPWWFRTVRKVMGKEQLEGVADYAHWNTNAIEEFEKIDNVDLHIVFVHKLMRKKVQRFEINKIHYYAVREDDYGMIGFFRTRFWGNQWLFDRSNEIIAKLIKEIHPDLVHMHGAEMLAHSPSLLYIPSGIPTLVQLETMLQDPSIKKLYQTNLLKQKQRQCERRILCRADYIGSRSVRFADIVRKYVKEDAVFVNTRLMIGEKGDMTPCEKTFDFTYFANYINKSVDLAIEAFGLAHQQLPELTLDVIGSVSDEEKTALISRLEELGCKDAVTIEGKLPTHEDVIKQIRKARFALLPLKVDSVSGTIREAMWNGIPVVSTITTGTPLLNKVRESILISNIGDHVAMAENMVRIANNSELAEKLRNNAAITVEETYGNNSLRAREWVEAYYACIENFYKGTPLPDAILNKN